MEDILSKLLMELNCTQKKQLNGIYHITGAVFEIVEYLANKTAVQE